MRIYVATGFAHKQRVHEFLGRCRESGLDVELTYDWTMCTLEDRPLPVAVRELAGIEEADVFVALLPGGSGTWSEIGYACGSEIPMVVVGAERDAHGWPPAPIVEVIHAVEHEEDAIDVLRWFDAARQGGPE